MVPWLRYVVVHLLFHRITAVNTSILCLLSVNIDIAAQTRMFHFVFCLFPLTVQSPADAHVATDASLMSESIHG